MRVLRLWSKVHLNRHHKGSPDLSLGQGVVGRGRETAAKHLPRGTREVDDKRNPRLLVDVQADSICEF